MNEHDYDELVVWQDVLDEILAGRSKGLRCPYCDAQALTVEKTPATLSIKCAECGKSFFGRMRV